MIDRLKILFLHHRIINWHQINIKIYWQVNYHVSWWWRHNEDGSYSYGYEAADGSYKIESKYPTGEVFGKYGFVDDTGNIREVEYGASRRGFEPQGPGINVPPPTLTGNSIANPNQPEDDGQYREDPSVYYTDPRFTNGERYEPRRPLVNNQPRPIPAPIYNPPR